MLPYGRNKTYRVVFEEKEKQKRRREKDSEDPRNAAVAYVDTARLLPTKHMAQINIRNFRNISVVLESGDLSEDLEVEGSGEQGDPTAPSAKVSRRPLEI